MNMRSTSRSLTFAVATLVGSTASLAAQEITSVGVLSGGTFSQCSAVSADGEVVVGISFGQFQVSPDRSFQIVGDGLPQDIGALPGATDIWASSLSGDGSTVIGLAFTPNGVRAFRLKNGAFLDLGVLPGAPFGAEAYGVSHNGAVVVGTSSSPVADWRAFRWTQQTGMVDLGALPGDVYSFGSATSANGNVVVGTSGGPNGERAFRWTTNQGMRALDSLDPTLGSGGFVVSPNGTWTAGYSGSSAVRWNAAGHVRDLGMLPGGSFSAAYAISGNGQVVGGVSDDITMNSRAALWTPLLGMVDANELLPALGVDLTGWTLSYVTGMSPDGRTLVGLGEFEGQGRGFIVRVGHPGPGGLFWLLARLFHEQCN